MPVVGPSRSGKTEALRALPSAQDWAAHQCESVPLGATAPGAAEKLTLKAPRSFHDLLDHRDGDVLLLDCRIPGSWRPREGPQPGSAQGVRGVRSNHEESGFSSFRAEAVRAGFRHCHEHRDFQTIIEVAGKRPPKLSPKVLQEDEARHVLRCRLHSARSLKAPNRRRELVPGQHSVGGHRGLVRRGLATLLVPGRRTWC